MTPVADMRWCPWCQQTLPADHPCAGNPEPPERRQDPMTTLIERPTLTPAAAKWLHGRLQGSESDLAALRKERARYVAEVAAIDAVIATLETVTDQYRECLADAPPFGDSDREELPVEAAAHAAVEGREHPYAPTQCGGA